MPIRDRSQDQGGRGLAFSLTFRTAFRFTGLSNVGIPAFKHPKRQSPLRPPRIPTLAKYQRSDTATNRTDYSSTNGLPTGFRRRFRRWALKLEAWFPQDPSLVQLGYSTDGSPMEGVQKSSGPVVFTREVISSTRISALVFITG